MRYRVDSEVEITSRLKSQSFVKKLSHPYCLAHVICSELIGLVVTRFDLFT